VKKNNVIDHLGLVTVMAQLAVMMKPRRETRRERLRRHLAGLFGVHPPPPRPAICSLIEDMSASISSLVNAAATGEDAQATEGKVR
jgi:hypothetical protein